MLDYVSKRIVSIVLTPQSFLCVAFEEIFGCPCTRDTSFDISIMYFQCAVCAHLCLGLRSLVVDCEMSVALVF